MAARTVTGVLRKPITNALWTGAEVTFRLTKPFAIAGGTYPTQTLAVTADATTAVITVTLAVPDAGGGSARYECILPDKRNFVFYLAAGVGNVNFEDLVAGAFAGEEAGESLQAIIDNIIADANEYTDAHAAVIASAGTLGHVRIGAGITIDEDGVISAAEGAASFLGLADTPDDYAGSPLYFVRVNFTQDGLIFSEPSGLGFLIAGNNLSDVPNDATARTNIGAAAAADLDAHELLPGDSLTMGHVRVGDGLQTDGNGLLSVFPIPQPFDDTLMALSFFGTPTAADRLPYFTGVDTAGLTAFTAFARTLLDDANQAAMQATLGLVPGTNVQAQDAELQAIAGLTSAADKGIQFTGAGTAGTFDLTAAGKALLDDADAAAQRATLSLGTLATQNGSFTGGGTLATGGFTLTVPADGMAALRGTANIFTALNTFQAQISSPDTGHSNSERFGSGAIVGGASTLAAGQGASASNANATAVGQGSSATSSSTALGKSAAANNTDCIVLGRNAASTGANQFVAGSSNTVISNVFFGSGVTAASPAAATINGSGGSGTNIAGANLVLAGGKGTGTGAAGKVQLQTAPAGSSGSSLNALVTAVEVDGQSTGAEESRLLLLDLSDGTVKRVTFGADDSGGAGYKVLRIAN